LRALSSHFEIDLVAFRRRVDQSAVTRTGDGETPLLASVHRYPIPQEHSRLRYVLDHGRSLMAGTPYTALRYANTDFGRCVHALLARHDYSVLHVESLDLVGYLNRLPLERTVLVHHNVESDLLRERADRHPRGWVRGVVRLQAERVERAERDWCARVAVNVCVSEADSNVLHGRAPAGRFEVVPNGVDTEYFRPNPSAEAGGLVFCGVLDWYPNADALEFFVSEIQPLLDLPPDTPVTWVGRHDGDLAGQYAGSGVRLPGFVPDIRPLVWGASCYVVPLRMGSGTRLKVLDAWAMGKAVVSTSVGCAGLAARDGENILIADSAPAFADAVKRVLGDAELRHLLGAAGRSTVERQYSWKVVGDAAVDLYRDLADRQTARSRITSS
jgi:glycosyltransferase involved in cell wall biosynthesis